LEPNAIGLAEPHLASEKQVVESDIDADNPSGFFSKPAEYPPITATHIQDTIAGTDFPEDMVDFGLKILPDPRRRDVITSLQPLGRKFIAIIIRHLAISYGILILKFIDFKQEAG
jgi:hypothetical protein